jgi:MFS family permease
MTDTRPATGHRPPATLLPIFLVVFVDLLGFSIILPLLPYYAIALDASDQTIGYLVATYSLCQFVAGPILGSLSDRFGRRPLLIYSQLGSFAGFLLLAAAMFLPNPLLWLFVARVVDGLSGGNISIAQAYIADVTEPKDRAKSYGLIGVAFGLGFLVGPALGGFLSRYGYDVPAYAAAFFSLSSVVATLVLLPETQHRPDETRRTGLGVYTRVFEYFEIAALRRLLAIFLFFALPFALYVSMFALYAERQLGFTAEQTGYFLGFVGLLGIVWQGGAVGPVVRAVGERRALLLGLASSALGLFSVVFATRWEHLIVTALLFSFGTGMTRPSLTSMVTQAAPPDRRGGVLGVTSSLESFSRIVAPVVGGWIIAFHPTWLGWVGGALGVVALLLAASWRGDH